ncbi:metal-dependent hydrolase [Rufibacter roseolus]|uniref:metal-dependent hydrolase n=1 Tax=Rufibacter roseolus TaxID=2817375 RepID=UPI001B3143E6|nr:metal-dependent hydrolase [Rufibacter roseolus]
MFIGHFAFGFGAKSAAPRVSLGTLFLTAQLLDLLWPTFLLLGWERVVISPGITKVTPLDFTHYPISHSLLLVLGWGLLSGGLYWLLSKYRRGALVVAICVLSHWVLDLVMHRPDLPLYPGDSPLLGLGLWNSLAGSLLVEGLLFAIGVELYLRSTQARNRTGNWSLWALIIFLVVVYLLNLFGPAPPAVSAIAWAGQLQWLFVGWGYWIDRNRRPLSQRGLQPENQLQEA